MKSGPNLASTYLTSSSSHPLQLSTVGDMLAYPRFGCAVSNARSRKRRRERESERGQIQNLWPCGPPRGWHKSDTANPTDLGFGSEDRPSQPVPSSLPSPIPSHPCEGHPSFCHHSLRLWPLALQSTVASHLLDVWDFRFVRELIQCMDDPNPTHTTSGS